MNPRERKFPAGERVQRLKPLDASLWQPYQGYEIEGTLRTIALIKEYWESLFPRFGFVIVIDDDQGLYDTLYHNLFFMLGQRPELHMARELIRGLVPDSENLPNHRDAVGFDEEISSRIYDDLRSARTILNRILIAEGRSFGDSPVDALFDLFAKELIVRRSDNKQQAERFAARLGFDTLPKTPRPSGKPGRPSIEIENRDAQSAYWHLIEDFEQDGERRKPSHGDLCDYLCSRGVHIGISTFGKHVRQWKKAGLAWPPPMGGDLMDIS
jgi:hypothetical protein